MNNVLDHPVRRTIVALLRQGELPAGAMAEALRKPRPGTSYHLAVLHEEGIVSCRIEGSRRIYRLNVERLCQVLDATLEDAWRNPPVGAVA